MALNLKQYLRRRVLGRQFQRQVEFDHNNLPRLGNRFYYGNYPDIQATNFSPSINAYEFSCMSQNGEDGIILHLLSKIGVVAHYIVEVGIEEGTECNSANLIHNFGWRAGLIEGSASWAMKAAENFQNAGVTEQVSLQHSMATPENINELLGNINAPEEIDVLSIDIDSHDYWLWKAITVVNPRIVVIEYNGSFGDARSITVPYPMPDQDITKCYHGASLLALQKLGQEKGYALVGTDNRGINAFFVRNDLAQEKNIESVTVEQCFRPHKWRTQKLSVEEQLRQVESLPLEEV